MSTVSQKGVVSGSSMDMSCTRYVSKRRYKKIIMEYFKKYHRGTVYDVIGWMKSRRVKQGRISNHFYSRGLLVPTVDQVCGLIKKIGGKKVGMVRIRRNLNVVLWEVKIQDFDADSTKI